jgi:outer membrane receptor protein involved in Fe transport
MASTISTSRQFLLIAIIVCVAGHQALGLGRTQLAVHGTVRDSGGAAVKGAGVTLKAAAMTVHAVTNDEGHFEFENVTARTGIVLVEASGFAPLEQKWSAETVTSGLNLDLVLTPAGISQQMTVTAARTAARVNDTAGSVIVLSQSDLSNTAALTLDDTLRQVEGFSLFRRSGSRTTNPTSQGVTLRGVGASGASRALVLADGIPLNDPFGGWVYWDRIPREEIGRVEILQGAGSSLYGTDAMGGVINVMRQDLSESWLNLEASYGNEQTPSGSFSAGGTLGKWLGRISGEAFHTDGYIIVNPGQRGLADTPAGSEHRGMELQLQRILSEQARVFVRGSLFSEDRRNGTAIDPNRTHIRQLETGGNWRLGLAGDFSVRLWGGTQVFDQRFASVAADRNSASLVRSQRVPAQQIGIDAQWSRTIGSRQTVVAGLNAREVRGSSDELIISANRVTSAVGAGGREHTSGLFGEDIIRLAPSWLLTLGLRFDRWHNYDALSATRPFSPPGTTAVRNFADRSESALSPKVSVLHRVNDNVTLSASAYQAFRAPTLNELYRTFRLGNIVTNANPGLVAERLTGGEAGASVSGLQRRIEVRGTFFWNEISRPVANVTLTNVIPPPAPGTIVRQRQNLGSSRSRGFELNATARIANSFSVSAGYEFIDASVLSFSANRALVGKLIPQVPQNELTVQATYSNPSILTLSTQGRFVGNQFDDDVNAFLLGRYFTMDVLASRAIGHGVELFGAIENLLNQRYAVALTPTQTIGPGVLGRAGIRLRLGSR